MSVFTYLVQSPIFSYPQRQLILLLLGLFVTFTLFILFYHAIDIGLLTSMAVIMSSGFASGLSLFVLYRGTRFRGAKVDNTQVFLVTGICLWFGAELIFGYYQIWLNIEAPFPSVADAIYIAGYAFFTYYLFRTLKTLGQEVEREVLILVSLAVAVSLGYTMNLSFGVAQLISVDNEILAMAISICYPVLDGLLLVPAVVLLWGVKKGDSSQSHWVMISLFILLNAVGDIGFGYSAFIGTLNEEVWIWDIPFTVGYIAVIAGLLLQNRQYPRKISNYHHNIIIHGVSNENEINPNNMH
jgi:branched-chain amino acid transport system substrate-binding protein